MQINTFLSNHGFPLNLANDPSATFHLKRRTVYPSNQDLPLPSTLSNATLRLTYLAKLQPLSNSIHSLHLAIAGTSDSALMLTMCALQMFVLLLLLPFNPYPNVHEDNFTKDIGGGAVAHMVFAAAGREFEVTPLLRGSQYVTKQIWSSACWLRFVQATVIFSGHSH